MRADRFGSAIPVMAEIPAVQLFRVDDGRVATTADDEQVRFAPDIVAQGFEGNIG